MTKNASYRFGIFAENIAIWYLRCKLYNIIAHRYKSPFGEIDIIAKKGKEIIFIEIKARKDLTHFELISKRQKVRIIKAAEFFLLTRPKFNNYNLRFDAIFLGKNLLPIHFKNYW